MTRRSVETQLTTDGERLLRLRGHSQGGRISRTSSRTRPDAGRGQATAAAQSEMDKKFGRARVRRCVLAQDDKKFSVQRSTTARSPTSGSSAPWRTRVPASRPYKYGMPGEENQTQFELHVFDIAAKKPVKVKTEAFKDQQMAWPPRPHELQREKGEAASTLDHHVRRQGLFQPDQPRPQAHHIVEADHGDGESRVVIPERSNTYIELQPLRFIDGGKQMIHWSSATAGPLLPVRLERKLIRQITSGEFVCTSIKGIDERTESSTRRGRPRAGRGPVLHHTTA